MQVRMIDGVIQWSDIVGKYIKNTTSEVVCSNFEDNKLYIQEYITIEGKVKGVTSVISTLNTEQCLGHLKLFGYSIEIIQGFKISDATLQKIQGLIQAGFKRLIKSGNNYTVDNIFQQTILSEYELQYFLNNDILDINLSEIK